MTKKAPVPKKAPPKKPKKSPAPRPKKLHTKPVPPSKKSKKWTRSAATIQKASGQLDLQLMKIGFSLDYQITCTDSLNTLAEVIDIVESSISQEEVDEGNARLLESPPAAEAQPTQPSSASEGEGVASPSCRAVNCARR